MTHLFVYGTLKQGGRLNHLMSPCTFVAQAITFHWNYQMSDSGFDFPYVSKHGMYRVMGEVWEVPIRHLEYLDMVEAGYDRELVRVEYPLLAKGMAPTTTPYMYLRPERLKGKMIKGNNGVLEWKHKKEDRAYV